MWGCSIESRSTDGSIGYVGGLRDVVLGIDRLDECPAELTIDAIRLFAGDHSFMYRFAISSEGRDVMTGRASIFLKHGNHDRETSLGDRRKRRHRIGHRRTVGGRRICRDCACASASDRLNRSSRRSVAAGGLASSLSCDITDADATRQALESLLKDGPIQIVVNNAGRAR